ncbi:MAG: penicillin-binding protein activator LpoB [Moraxellaceae bacterium]|jgi:PBP1b-binding outer membrane lipoprotein LpoB|nr:penicillin-binding protein activator LpoB [Moraxellaceae bacterium]
MEVTVNQQARRLALPAFLAIALQGCATLETAKAPRLEKNTRWAMLPALNNTETPQAAQRLEAITASLLRKQGVNELLQYPAASGDDLLKPVDRRSQEAALKWARSQNARYAVTGSVEEWRYKTGLDGRPAAGITLSIIDTATGQVIWSGTGARTGFGREAITGVAQKLIDELVDEALARATHTPAQRVGAKH